MNFVPVADAILMPTGLPPDSSRSGPMKAISSSGVEKALWRAGETQSASRGTPRVSAISGVILAFGRTPPWPGFGALAELDLDHLDLRVDRLPAEKIRIEMAVLRAAAEIAAGDLPDDVAAMSAVVGADRAFAGVVGEAAHAWRRR